jgi:hypothetical protein
MKAASIISAVILLAIGLILSGDKDSNVPVTQAEERSPFPDLDFDISSADEPGSPQAPVAALRNYLEYSKYPPTSRPITAGRAAHFQYNRRDDVPVPVAGPDGRTEFYISVRTDRMMVFGAETVRILLKAVAGPDAEGERKAVELAGAAVFAGRRDDARRVLDVTLVDNGRDGDVQSGDHEYTAMIQPASIASLKSFHGDLAVHVEFRVNGVKGARRIYFSFYPESAIAARFTGKFRNAIEDGSLAVYAQINVSRAGNYTIDANLSDADGQAFCHARFKQRLEPGLREVRLLFFGKVIRDANPVPRTPFRVTEIFGQALPPSELAAQMDDENFAPAAVPLYSGDYTVDSHEVRDFSDAEWESPDKQFQIEQLREAAARGSWLPR